MIRLSMIGVFLILDSVLGAIRPPFPKEQREAWEDAPIVSNLDDSIPDGLDLAFVNIIWRHGDRAPTQPMAGEKAPEEFWTFGGGGWGELSPLGMTQHYNLGKKLFSRYANNSQFLSETYKSREIYVHCTDTNRTVVSAMSNLAGMYSRSNAKVGRDYPDMAGWPTFLVPVPIHTEYPDGMDHIGDPASQCPRQDDIWKLVQKTKDYKDANGPDTQETLRYLREATGVEDSEITFENIYKIWDNMLVENIWFPDNVTEWYPYYTPEVNQQVTDINDMGIDLKNGIIKDNIIDGYDLTLEIKRVRGGPIVNDIMAKARGVLQCRLKDSYGQQNGCKGKDQFYRSLKYHAISSHDTTVAAYLTILGAKTSIIPDVYPHYSAAVLTEFFIDARNGGTEQVFRVIYHDAEDADFRVITQFVEGCNQQEFCPLEILQDMADKFAPPGGIDQLCQQRIPY